MLAPARPLLKLQMACLRDTSAAGSEASSCAVELRNCVAGEEACDGCAERCFGRVWYGLLGATRGRPPTEARLCILDTHAEIGSTTPAYEVALVDILLRKVRSRIRQRGRQWFGWWLKPREQRYSRNNGIVDA